ncbi:hypothetical protein [Roseovarius arcticus]|uniref:hypothetical protein n=1 Tax=Roseovarius arcticus TaxID=2547404 RepID=UPI0011108EFF|nr:hypothetical protein [Roseovarius arcticus]
MTHSLTKTVRSLVGRAAGRLARRSRTAGHTGGRSKLPDLDALSRHIILPSLPITDEEVARAAFQDRGLQMARQEMWEELAEQIRDADHARTVTPGGESAAILLAFGARSDVVSVVEDMLHDGIAPPPGGIDALEAIAADFPEDYPIPMIVALAHIDLAWAWRTIPGAAALEGAAECSADHAARAQSLLSPLCGIEQDAPSLAAAHCALLAALPNPQDAREARVADWFEDLIDLDPVSPRHMRALGAALLPARLGSYAELELEARRTAARTGDCWGAGAYAWVYFDALALDAGALALLDPVFFVDGLRDILQRRPDQHTANLLAAFCAVTMRKDAEAPHANRAACEALHGCLSWILRDHLYELHPLIWTQALHHPGAAPLPSRRALISEGRRTALRAIAAQFADDLAGGHSITFSPAGMYLLPTL